MNRRTKIIVSVSGIFIVLLALLGLTYAYFLTKINGNTNDKSISVTTANLELTYQDGNGTITANNIIPGTTIASKTFTVNNTKGTSADYVVVLENVVNNFSRQQDLTYTLTCKSSKSSDSCDGINNLEFPGTTDVATLVQNIIPGDTIHTYNLTIKYAETGVDQSVDMGVTLSAKANIRANTAYREGTLVGAIINNAKANKNGTEYRTTPLTIPGKESSTSAEKSLSVTSDDYGTSYYYRGNVTNNYLNFGGMCWRIVRIDGKNNVKIVLGDRNHECDDSNYGVFEDIYNTGDNSYDYETLAFINGSCDVFPYNKNDALLEKFENSNLVDVLDAWLNGGTVTSYDSGTSRSLTFTKKIDTSKLVDAEWCNDFSISSYVYYDSNWHETSDPSLAVGIDKNYGTHDRLTNGKVSLKCNFRGLENSRSEKYKSKIGMLTVDEAAFAGIHGMGYSSVKNTYLSENAGELFWTMSPMNINIEGDLQVPWFYNIYYGSRFFYTENGGIDQDGESVRPALVLRGDSKSTGDGTRTNPYKVD